MIAFFGDLARQLNPPALNIDLGQQISVLNLEGPVLDPTELDDELPLKAGPRLFSSVAMLSSFIKSESSWIFSLANNHSIDFGEEGLLTTLESLAKADINNCGAGKNREEALKVLQIEVDGVGIAIISCADRGFGFATTNQAGFALEGNWVFHEIVLAKRNKLLPVVLYHGGVEDFSLPSPYTKQLFESWADVGAKLVIGTHSHVPQPIVKYGESIICYGLGNFLVDPSDWPEMSEVNLSSLCLLFNPVDMCFSIRQLRCGLNDAGTIEVKSKQFTEELNNRLEVAAEIMDDKNLHSAVWQEMCVEIKSLWLRKHFLFSFINEIAPPAFQRLPYIGKFFRIPFALDSIAWSVHREMLITLSELKNHIRPDERTLKSSEYWSVIKGKCD